MGCWCTSAPSLIFSLTYTRLHTQHRHTSTPARCSWTLTGPGLHRQHPSDAMIQRLVRGHCVSARDSCVCFFQNCVWKLEKINSDQTNEQKLKKKNLCSLLFLILHQMFTQDFEPEGSIKTEQPLTQVQVLFSCCSCLNVRQLGGHGGLGVFALKMLLEGLGVRHLCLEGEPWFQTVWSCYDK